MLIVECSRVVTLRRNRHKRPLQILEDYSKLSTIPNALEQVEGESRYAIPWNNK